MEEGQTSPWLFAGMKAKRERPEKLKEDRRVKAVISTWPFVYDTLYNTPKAEDVLYL